MALVEFRVHFFPAQPMRWSERWKSQSQKRGSYACCLAFVSVAAHLACMMRRPWEGVAGQADCCGLPEGRPITIGPLPCPPVPPGRWWGGCEWKGGVYVDLSLSYGFPLRLKPFGLRYVHISPPTHAFFSPGVRRLKCKAKDPPFWVPG